MSDEAVCRTAPATPGLLTTWHIDNRWDVRRAALCDSRDVFEIKRKKKFWTNKCVLTLFSAAYWSSIKWRLLGLILVCVLWIGNTFLLLTSWVLKRPKQCKDYKRTALHYNGSLRVSRVDCVPCGPDRIYLEKVTFTQFFWILKFLKIFFL